MNIEEIGEPIRMLAAFSGGGVEPLRFCWGGRTYEIDAVNGRWIDRNGNGNGNGNGYALHYSVQVGDETYYIHFSSPDVQWWLDRIIVG